MEATSRTRLNDNQLLPLFVLIVIGFLVRWATVQLFIDAPGDGPTRALIAYDWAESPYLSTHGVWPPGFTYLAGFFSLFVHNPLISVRILNIILGTLTIPVFYQLTRLIFGHPVAIFSASILTFFPLHVGLSASSLTEVSFLFVLLLGTLFLIQGFKDSAYNLTYLIASFAVLFLAEMMRYETWVLIPAFIIYVFLKTRNIWAASLTLALLLIFPIGWMIGNQLASGNALIGFTEAARGTESGVLGVSIFGAVAILVTELAAYMGWVLPIFATLGISVSAIKNLRQSLNPEEIFYLSITCIYWAVMFRFIMTRGDSLWDRYLLFGLIFLLPFILYPLRTYLMKRNKKILLFSFVSCVLVLTSFAVGKASDYSSSVFLTHKQPTEIIEVVDWLQQSPYEEAPVILTRMDWDSTYFSLYDPDSTSRTIVVSLWITDTQLEDFIEQYSSFIFITREGDDDLQTWVAESLGVEILAKDLIQEIGRTKVYYLPDVGGSST